MKSPRLSRRLFASIAALFLIICLFATGAAESSPSLTLSENALSVGKGRSSRITATLTDAKTKLTWKSSDPSIAVVNSGTITAKQNGIATITCSTTLDDGSELSAACEVTVYTPLQSIKAAQTMTIDIGQQTAPVEITFTPADAGYQSVVWTSDNESVATVDEEGRILGIAEGTCKITATSTEPVSGTNPPKSTSIRITVYRPVDSIELDAQDATIRKGKTLRINAVVSPENATNKKVTWKSSDTNLATVSNGTVTAKAGGIVTITCSVTNQTGEVVSSEYALNIVSPVSSLTPPSTPVNVIVGSTSEPLTVKFQPADATCRDLIWSSKDESIATVDEEGRITGIKAGKTSIVATSTDPFVTGEPKSCTIHVNVNQGAESLSLAGDTVIAKGKTAKLTCTILPENTTNKKIEWSSSDEKVARVTNGTITAAGVGNCTITGKMADGSGVTATHNITVIQAVTQIQPTKTSRIAVTEGKSVTLSVNVLPKDATNKTVTWSSESPSIATVDSNGKVTGKNAGTCTIKATAADGSGRSAKMTVVVEPKVPLDATTFTRSGYFGAYYEFAIKFKNLTKTRTIKYISFDLKYTYNGQTKTFYGFYDDQISLGPGNTKQSWWWDQLGYRLGYCTNFRVYLRSVQYSDGTWDYFGSEDALLGWF